MDQFWLPLVVGIIVGWLIEWLLDWGFWRRQLSGLRQQNADLRVRLAAAEDELARRPAPPESASAAPEVPPMAKVADLTSGVTPATSGAAEAGDRSAPPSEGR